MMTKILSFFTIFTGALLSFSGFAFAQDGKPVDWQLNFQNPASTTAEFIFSFHTMLLWIVTAITIFVLLLLVYVVLRYNRHVNKTPAKFSHNVIIEVLWTAIPVIILIVIAIPSFKLLYYSDRAVEPEMTLKVTGYQWYWGYEYPDYDGINFLSYMIPDDEIDKSKGQERLLSTDNAVVLPIDTDIQILVTAADVLHSFAMPALGLKTDAIPGRFNETWVRITKPGTYFGQCSEICGKNHAYMPIEIKAVSKEEFKEWTARAKAEFSSLPANTNTKQNLKIAHLTGAL